MRRHQQAKHALGSAAYLTVVLPDDEPADQIFENLWRRIVQFEQRFSRFLPDSELSMFNHVAGTWQAASPEFRELLATAKSMAEKTGGLYSPFVLPALQRAGYKGSWPQPEVANEQLNYEQRGGATWSDIEINRAEAVIPKNTALDFGGIGKGYLLDELSDWLQSQSIQNYWLSLGGDILCAGLDEPGIPWRIGIQHALLGGEQAANVVNDGKLCAIATSGVTKREGVSGGTKWHHIIDPRTGRPAETDILTATVCSESATEADVFAKCLVIAGSAGTRAFMESVEQANVLLQLDAGDRDVIIQQTGTTWLV